MYIQSLELSNYRNYRYLHMDFSPCTTILYGDNAQGKTNILEAIYLSSTTKSHRGSKDKEIIALEEEQAHVKALIKKGEFTHKIDMHLRKNKNKGIAIDQIPIKKSSELLGLLNVIIFSPEDLSIIKDGPAERRRFLDMELCQLDSLYMYNYMNYQKVLNQRNNLLKQIYFKKNLLSTLDVWDMQLLQYGKEIIKARRLFIQQINVIIKDIHSRLSGGTEELYVEYSSSVSEEEYEDMLLKKREIDIKYQSTQMGPHRDDMVFYINGLEVKKYGSQGQQRTAALSLKLAEIELVKLISSDYPVLLLDDVMSELDEKRRDFLLKSIHDIQTIITCTGYDDFIKTRLNVNQVYRVNQGTVQLEGMHSTS